MTGADKRIGVMAIKQMFDASSQTSSTAMRVTESLLAARYMRATSATLQSLTTSPHFHIMNISAAAYRRLVAFCQCAIGKKVGLEWQQTFVELDSVKDIELQQTQLI